MKIDCVSIPYMTDEVFQYAYRQTMAILNLFDHVEHREFEGLTIGISIQSASGEI